jgi:hypothetical protein
MAAEILTIIDASSIPAMIFSQRALRATFDVDVEASFKQ